MSEIIGPPKDVALYQSSVLLREAIERPITNWWRRKARAQVRANGRAAFSDVIPKELMK